MRAPPFRGVLLALVLVFGQWLGYAHARDEGYASVHQNCDYCVHAQGLAAGLVALPASLPVAHGHERPLRALAAGWSAPAPAHYDIRGPPVHATR